MGVPVLRFLDDVGDRSGSVDTRVPGDYKITIPEREALIAANRQTPGDPVGLELVPYMMSTR